MEISSASSLAFYVLFHFFYLAPCQDAILQVQRTIMREGFHRDIMTAVTLPSGDVITRSECTCSLLLIETLPSSLYVDTFQLDNLAQFGGPQVLTDEPINIEAPEYQSKEHTLYVYTALPSDKQPSGYPLIISVTLPVHVRYHKPATDLEVTHVPIIMYPPRVLFNCSNTRTVEELPVMLITAGSRMTDAPCDAQNTSQCMWAELPYKTDTHLLEFSVPMGRESDMRVVVFGTIVVTVMGCTVLLYIIAFYDQWKMKVKER